MANIEDDTLDLDDDEEEIDTVSTLTSTAGSSGTKNSSAATSSANTSATSASGDSKKKHHFYKELRCMMYGYGDDKAPYTETVELLEDVVVEFIRDFVVQSIEVGKTGKLQLEDIWYLIRRDPKKYAKVKDLLTMNEELRKARKAFDEAKHSTNVANVSLHFHQLRKGIRIS